MTQIKKSPIIILLFAALGTFLSRWHGGGFISGSPKVLKNFLWALPFALVTYVASNIWWVSLLALGACIIGKGTGHGGGMDLAHSEKEPGAGRDPEKLEYLILWLHGKIDQYWYDALLLVLVGLAAVSGGAMGVGYSHPVAGVIVAVGGAMKALGYMIGWKIFPSGKGKLWEQFDEATEIGEGLTGLFAYLGLGLALVMIWT